MQIIDPSIEKYISLHTKSLHPILDELERETYEYVPMPNMLSGKEQGTFLNLFVAALQPKMVVEIGTFTGYAAICMALAMDKSSQLISLEKNAEVLTIATKYIKKIGLESVIETRECNAVDVFGEMEDESIDLVFVDADKSNYPTYLSLAKKKVRKGGYILIDNVLWKGRVVDADPDNRTKAIQKTNDMVFEDKDLTSIISPLRDGLLIARKN